MYTLPAQANTDVSFLNVWFRYNDSSENGFNRLQQFLQPCIDFASGKPIRPENNYQPLTTQEEQRWKQLERKAKQDNLAGYDAVEHEVLLQVKLYQRLKVEEPSLVHHEILEVLRQSL